MSRHIHPPSRGQLAPALLLGLATCLPTAVMAAHTAVASSQLVTTAQASAETDNNSQSNANGVKAVNISAAQAARTARHKFGGKVLGVALESKSQSPYYRVRLISSGKIHIVHVNAHD